MFKQKLIVRIELAVIAAILAGTSLYASKVLGKTQPSPQKLVDEVWQILDKNYVDANFNHQDWKAIRQQYLSRSYSSKKEAYGAIQEMVAKLGDRYTEFYDPQEFKALNSDISGNLSGVGLELAENEKTKALTVVAPIEATPAFKAGILPGDLIVQINGQITQGMKIEDAVKRIVGPVGTKVVLTIKRGSQSQTFKLTRANIAIHPVTYNTQTTAVGKIGYILLPEFTQTAPAQMHRAIEALEKQQVQGYVLDLRSDPGGLLDASLQIASMWLKQGAIVSLVNRDRVKDSYNASGHPLTNKPLVILVDKGSASASEILSGALQDDNRATLVGTRTFGKGLVQAVEPLDDGSGLKLTIAKYYTPKGRDINHVGIAPDINVELSEAQQKALVENRTLGTLADPQYASAVADLSKLIQSGVNRMSLQGGK
ncbi:MAG: S41 family peptidase [Nostoc sp. NMS1]|uniref:S41 family peptidase n=1 Tax=unclassified Nostoc TaxID=2593658 RepID=UPI0025FC91E2|nr:MULTISPECIES: S41 family peptidase [unclassified Nostoc]MBN3906286.1 S41 family peptidase [Nostoc sp. NMS1]MBN3992005.1 S41 family peptidase [Nostoc sp. NMS2]